MNNIRKELREILDGCPYIYYHREVLTEKDITKIVDENKFKAVGYQILPVKIDVSGRRMYKVSIYVIDMTDESEELVEGTLESSMDAINYIYKKFTLKSGDLSVEQDIIHENDNDRLAVMVAAEMNVVI
jgi:hypothetical protein